jgi:hypothetical protein
VAGRRRAVFVAITVAAIILSVVPFVAHSATEPPGINRFLYALGQVESGGSYTARNPSSGAYGKYQIIPSNWPAWAKLYVGSSSAPWTPVNQEAVARGKVTALWNWLDTWPNVAHWWLTGSGDTNRAHWSSYSKYYVDKLMKIYGNVSDVTAAEDVMATPPKPVVGKAVSPRTTTTTVAATTRRIGEGNIGIAYTGRWRPAGTRATPATTSSTVTSGATATYPFYGKSVAWIGPAGRRGRRGSRSTARSSRDRRPRRSLVRSPATPSTALKHLATTPSRSRSSALAGRAIDESSSPGDRRPHGRLTRAMPPRIGLAPVRGAR